VTTDQTQSETSPNAAADELYEAIKDYLMHEWQVPLVPTYADMSVSQVRSLGPRLLIIREMAELRRLIDGAAALSESEADKHPDNAEKATVHDIDDDPLSVYLTLDGRRLRPEAFILTMDRPEIRAALPGETYVDNMTGLNDIMWEVGGPAARIMINGLKVSPEQLGVMLVAAHTAMGKQVFTRLFGFPGQPELVLRLVQQGLADGVGKDTTYENCAKFIYTFVERAASHRAKENDKG
jgi:hypothetical protein